MVTAAPVAESAPVSQVASVSEPAPTPATAPSNFAQPRVQVTRTRNGDGPYVARRVLRGDVVRAPYYDRVGGPANFGRILFGADLPATDRPRSNHNFLLYDRLLVVPPEGSAAAVRDRFVAYALGPSNEDVGTVVVPIAVLQVVRAPRNNEPAVVEVRELFGSLNADTRILPLDTTGLNVRGRPVAVPQGAGRNARLLEIKPRGGAPFARQLRAVRSDVDGWHEGRRRGVDLSGARGAEGRRRADAARGRDRSGNGGTRDGVRLDGASHLAGPAGDPDRGKHPSGRAHAVTGGGHALRLNAVTRGHALH